ncbi:hypothetical protein BS162P1_00075 [Bacteroides phage BS162P1]|jgi:hypothetical protein|nr:MAG: Recombination protein U [Bacteriophage sp.]WAX08854.1 hypothetical protein BS162P1_00075 [Bacteroides phage BS162P1]DAV31134.1 MAG TPA: hypothetical protein [Caudoviricetes sp.]
MPKKFAYIDRLFEKETTRARSKKQESRIARELKGHTSINSGATFGQNDVITDFCEVEAKTTEKESFSLTLADWRKLKKKCKGSKMPILVVDFEKSTDSLAVLTYDDLLFLIEKANKED